MDKRKLNAAVRKYQPLIGEGKSEEDIKAAISSDEKGYSAEEADAIFEALADTGIQESNNQPDDESTYKVVLMFRDKSNQRVYSPGDEYKSGDPERLKFLGKKGIIKKA